MTQPTKSFAFRGMITGLSLCMWFAQSTAQTLPPVDTLPPTADYKPAFPGQTRAPGTKTQTPVTATVINHELKTPFALRCLPDGRFLITEKPGAMRILKADGTFDKNIEGLPKVAVGYQGGLLDVNFDVTFTKDRTLFWSYSEQVPEGYLLAVAKGVLSPDDSKLENVQVIYRAIPATNSANLQFGSRIDFDKQGNLFVSTGDRSVVEMRVRSQDLNAATGKIVHITRDGKPVP